MVALLAYALCAGTLIFSYPGVGPPCGPGIEFVKELSLSAVNLTIAAGPSSLPGISGSERATFRVNGAEARAKYLRVPELLLYPRLLVQCFRAAR